jgi:hypothetical protein
VSTLPLALVALAATLALISLGGGFCDFLVVDPFWPRRPDLIQPHRGGISRKRFWIPAHTVFELALIASLIAAWGQPAVRTPLLVALASHAAMRIWSAFDFIPKASNHSISRYRCSPHLWRSETSSSRFSRTSDQGVDLRRRLICGDCDRSSVLSGEAKTLMVA